MSGTLYRLLLVAMLTSITLVNAARYTVCKSGDCNFKTIQAAIDAAIILDEVVIMDDALYEEQVTIDSTKDGLTLRSYDPLSKNKPTIRFKDITNVQPKTYAETQNNSTITYCLNGALRILSAASVRIEGIIVDGGGAEPFAYPAVWGGVTPLFHGNAALVLNVTGSCLIRDCEFQNAYYGIFCRDRNEGGINARANPTEFDTTGIIPFSAFARSGDHLFEHNRIHHNTWGLYFESMWDLGSTVRYNLIYDNHHASDAAAARVAAMPAGKDQAGGAMLFKDVQYSPVAIHNNTFWRNYLNFARLSGAGAHHLIFNNIYGRPFRLWADDPNFPNPPAAFDQLFVNRMFNSVYSPQAEPPETSTVRILDSIYDAGTGSYVRIDTTIATISRMRIMAGMEQVKKGMEIALTAHLSSGDTILRRTIDNAIQPGNPITAGTVLKPFPESSNVRWVEIPFLSTNPANNEFLIPDWSSELVQKFIIDQGRQACGARDLDGTPADIGAIPAGGGRPAAVATIRLSKPVDISGNTAYINFEIAPRLADMELTNPRITYFYAVTNLDTGNGISSAYQAIAAGNVTKIDVPAGPISIGQNSIELPSPAGGIGKFAFFEMIVECTGPDGRPVTASVGFLPFRKLAFTLSIQILDNKTQETVMQVNAGTPYLLRVDAWDGDVHFANKLDPTDVFLQSRYDLLNPTGGRVETIQGGIAATSTTEVVFTRVPEGGVEYVHVAGMWISGEKVIAFLGSSQGVTVKAGPADSIAFHQPASGMTDIIDQGTVELVKVRAFDKFGNPADTAFAIKVISLDRTVGTVTDTIQNTTYDGLSTHHALVTNGDKGQIFTIVASLLSNPLKTDTAYFKVGDGSAILPHAPVNHQPRPVLCELIDLRGKVLRREVFDSRNLSGAKLPFSAATGRGMYIMKVTDMATGKVQSERRLLLTR